MPGGDYRDALRERAGWVPEAGPLLDADGARVGEHGGTAGLHGRPAPGPRRRARRAALRQPDRSADQHDHARAARGPRDDDGRRSSGRRSSPATRRAAASPFRAEIRIRHRATPIAATVRPATPDEPARGGRWLVETDTPGLGRRARPGRRAVRRRRRARRRADRAADAAPDGRRARRVAPAARGARSARAREPRTRRSSSRSSSASSTRRCTCSSAATPAAGCRSSSSPRSSGRGPATRSADRLGFDVLTIGDFHLLGGIDRRLGRDRDLVGGGDPRPVGASHMSGPDEDRTTSSFLRGLTLGAILGAIIAGRHCGRAGGASRRSRR